MFWQYFALGFGLIALGVVCVILSIWGHDEASKHNRSTVPFWITGVSSVLIALAGIAPLIPGFAKANQEGNFDKCRDLGAVLYVSDANGRHCLDADGKLIPATKQAEIVRIP